MNDEFIINFTIYIVFLKFAIKMHDNILANMRKNKIMSQNRSHTEPTNQFSSVHNSRNADYLQIPMSKTNKLVQFQNELKNMIPSKKRSNSSQLQGINQKNKINKHLIPLVINQIKQEVGSIKGKILSYKKQIQINKGICETLPQKIKELKDQQTYNLPPILSPYIYPPYFFPPPHYPDHRSKRRYYESSDSEESRQQRVSYKKKKNRNIRIKKKFTKMQRDRLSKILKKVFRAVIYYFYLKKLAKMISNKRKIVFNKFWPQNLQKSTNGMRKWFSLSCKRFFDEMIRKSEVEIQIEGDEGQKAANEKKKTIKSLVKILISCLQNLVQNQTFEQIAQILHIFCKHGAFIDNGVLTPEQINTVCISDTQGYLRLDRYMEKSQIINVLLIKLIVYNMLLQPWKYNSQLFSINQNKQGYQNFYYFSSVFYDLILDVQQNLLSQSLKSDKLIEVGNWTNLKSKFKIKCSPSLCHLDSNYQQGEMISGLVSEKAIKSSFGEDFWSDQLSKLQVIIQKMHVKLRKIHAKFVNQVYNYKDVSRFDN